MIRKMLAILLALILIPTIFLFMIITAIQSPFSNDSTSSDKTPSLIDVCINHEEIPAIYKTDDYKWVPSCRDDIYNMRTTVFGSFDEDSGGADSGTISANGNAKKCADFMAKEMKLPSVQIAGILGCWEWETHFHPEAINENANPKAYGLGQWRSGRYNNLVAYANKKAGNNNADNWKNIDAQLEFFKSEYDSGAGWIVPGDKQEFINAKTTDEATLQFLCGYEAGYGYETLLKNNPDGKIKTSHGSKLSDALNDYNRRKASAKSYLSNSTGSANAAQTNAKISSTNKIVNLSTSEPSSKKEAMASAILFTYAYIESDDSSNNNARYMSGVVTDWTKFTNCISDTDFTSDSYKADLDSTWSNLKKAGFKDLRSGDNDITDLIIQNAQEIVEDKVLTKVSASAESVQLYGDYKTDEVQWPIKPEDQTGSYTSFNDKSFGVLGSYHYGYDFGVKRGTPVYAAIDGVFCPPGQYTGLSAMGSGNEQNVWTNLVGTKYKVNYNHLSGFAPGIKPGSKVKKGQLIGYSGTANGVPHLCMRFCDANWDSGNRSDRSHFYTYSQLHLKEPMPLCNQHRGC